MDPFRVLGVSRNCTPEEAKKAYYKLVKEYHPDKNPIYVQKFRDVQSAYEKVKDFHKTGAVPPGGNAYQSSQSSQQSNWTAKQGGGPYNSNAYNYNRTHDQTNFDPNRYRSWSNTSSTFKDAEDYIWFVKKTFESDFFKNADIFNQQTTTTTTTTKGNTTKGNATANRQSKVDIHKLKITFVESCLGCEKTIQARTCFHCNGTGTKGYTEVICTECNGRGNLRVSQGPIHMVIPCPSCNRYGRVKKSVICSKCDGLGHFVVPKQYIIKIPKGVNDGEVIDIECDGHHQKVQIKVTPSSIFTRMANNIHSDVEIDYIQALMGDNIIVPTIHGDVCVKVPASTSSHSTIRIPGKGINGNSHVIHVKIRVPQNSGNQTAGLISQIAQLRGFNLNWNKSSDNSDNMQSYGLTHFKDKVILLFERLGFNVKFFMNIYDKFFKK